MRDVRARPRLPGRVAEWARRAGPDVLAHTDRGSDINALPGGVLLIGLPSLFAVLGAARPRPDGPPRWLPGDDARALDLLDRIRPGPAGRRSEGGGDTGRGERRVVPRLPHRLADGGAALRTGFHAGGDAYLYGVAIWTTAAVSAVAAARVGSRTRGVPLSTALATVFLATGFAASFMAATAYAGYCGRNTGSCRSAGSDAAQILYGRIGWGAPLEGAIATILLIAVARPVTLAAARLRPSRAGAEAADATVSLAAAAPCERRLTAILLTGVLVSLAAGMYVYTRYILFRHQP